MSLRQWGNRQAGWSRSMLHDRLILNGLLLGLGLFVGSTFDTTSMLLPLLLLASIVGQHAAYRRQRRDGSGTVGSGSRQRLAFLAPMVAIVLAVAWRSRQYGGDNANPIQAAADMIAHGCVFASMVGWVMRPNRGHVLMLGGGLVAVLACVLVGGASQTILGQTTVGVVTCLSFLVAAQIIGWAPLEHAGQHSGSSERRRDVALTSSIDGESWLVRLASGPWMFSAVAATGILTGTTLMAQAAGTLLPDIQKRLQDQLNNSLDALSDRIVIAGMSYVHGSRLGVIRNHILASPEEIAFRAFADSAPGYLRGTVFDTYRTRRWLLSSESSFGRRRNSDLTVIFAAKTATSPTFGAISEELLRFPIRDEDYSPGGRVLSDPAGSPIRQTKTIEVHNRPEKGLMIFTSLNTRWIEAVADSIQLTSHEVIESGVNITEPYVLGVVKDPIRQRIAPEQRGALLRVPGTLESTLATYADMLCSSEKTSQQNAQSVAQFFQSKFEYSLNQQSRPPRGVDPLKYFLDTRHPAHCEYFASATALILRQAGIPTRYVTGYVTWEKSTEEEYYLARNRDAHAWVEAYDDENQVWFAVESTPGRRYSQLDFENQSDLASDDDWYNANQVGEGDSGLFSWLYGRLIGSGVIAFFSSSIRSVQLPLFVLLVGLVWFRGRIRRQQHETDDDVRARRMLRHVDRKLKRYSLIRHSNETLHRFADRVEQASVDALSRFQQTKRGVDQKQSDRLASMADWYRRYAADRYRGRTPTPFA
ncbi:transglutaminase domain-containing protein [Crateriforma conspicua]|nr:transglutaminase-like domain-containing protein [Crateriforma conspicua]